MESFYGGRQGISFVIVKRFDAIDIEKDGLDSSYSFDYFAYDKEREEFIVKNNAPIRRTSANYKDYTWKRHYLDGSVISGAAVFPTQLIEGMVQCFEQGAITTNVVNYGEYVIIDTPSKNDPDNGKIYRRGLNYQKSDYNPLAGAEYIGQIVGATGDAAEISIGDYDENSPGKGLYNTVNGLISGANVNYQEDGSVVVTDYNDEIKYSWFTLRDEFDTVYGCRLGFQFPYHVFAITAESVDPYFNRNTEDKDFVNQNLVTRRDDGEHPYFSQWHISIPKGIKGDDIGELQIALGYAKVGTKYYTDEECTSSPKNLEAEAAVNFSHSSYDPNGSIIPIVIDETTYYVKNEDGVLHREVVIYKQINYNRSAEGDFEYIYVGDYNVIDDLTITSDGKMTVTYTHKDPKDFYLKTITDVQIDWNSESGLNKEGAGDQKVHITYSTGEDEAIGAPINYIMEAIITKEDPEEDPSIIVGPSRLLILYSDPKYRQKLKEEGKCVRYRSNKFIGEDGKGEIRDDWYDMGYVRGEPGTIRFIGNLTPAEAERILVKGQSPEKITGDSSMHGYCYTVGEETEEQKIIYYYDYLKEKWIILGSITSSLFKPGTVMVVGADGEEYPDLNPDGYLFALESSFFAE